MSEKYIELRQAIFRDLRDRGRPIAVSIGDVLEWLDEHPDQVPGRTITESDYRDLEMDLNDGNQSFGAVVECLGITVVPEPEPTNAEKLEKLLKQKSAMTNYGAVIVAKRLDAAGVTAPEGK